MESPESAIEAFVGTQFDYIVIGGGTAGLAVANRLSEDSNVTVGILGGQGYCMEGILSSMFPHNLGHEQWQPGSMIGSQGSSTL
ncbi:hypothetical protein B0H11DRAFT_2035109, partial [Mycena galericulata]